MCIFHRVASCKLGKHQYSLKVKQIVTPLYYPQEHSYVLVLQQIRICTTWTDIFTFSHRSVENVLDTNWQKFPCNVLFTGRVFWTPSGSFKSSCELNMYKFPFDFQTCSLDFGDLVNIESTVQLFPGSNSSDFASFLPSKEFRYCEMYMLYDI